MCMKYVNATAACYKSILMENKSIMSLNAPFNEIQSVDSVGIPCIDFFVATQIDFLGTNKEEHKKESPLEQKKKIDFIIRLTKCDSEEVNRICSDLDSFSIDLAEMNEKEQVSVACFGFVNYMRMTKVEKLPLPAGTGKYVLKILIKESESDEYTIQSMSKVTVL